VGDGDPSKPEYSHIPRIPVPQGDKSVLMKEVELLKEAFKKSSGVTGAPQRGRMIIG
jgi:hypothetical protein